MRLSIASTQLTEMAAACCVLVLLTACAQETEKSPPLPQVVEEQPHEPLVAEQEESLYDKDGILKRANGSTFHTVIPIGLKVASVQDYWVSFTTEIAIKNLEKFYSAYLPGWNIERNGSNMTVTPPDGMADAADIYVLRQDDGRYRVNYFEHYETPEPDGVAEVPEPTESESGGGGSHDDGVAKHDGGNTPHTSPPPSNTGSTTTRTRPRSVTTTSTQANKQSEPPYVAPVNQNIPRRDENGNAIPFPGTYSGEGENRVWY